MDTYVKMVVNQIIVIVFDILSMYIVENVFVLLKYTFLDGWSFHFNFITFVCIRHSYGTPTKNASIIAPITISKNNTTVLESSFIISVFCGASLKDKTVNLSKMVALNVSMKHVFKLLLFVQIMFILMINRFILYKLVKFLYLTKKLNTIRFN